MIARIGSANVNGIRAAARRGFDAWLPGSGCDVVGIQELRCAPELVPAGLFDGWHLAYEPGSLAGRNGVAVASRVPITAARAGIGAREFAHEGRYVEADLELDGVGLTVASVYVPKGDPPETDPEKHQRKLRFLAALGRHLTRSRRAAANAGRQFIVLGDFNIAHTPLDLKNWRGNQRSSGFLPEERAWFDAQLSARTLVDVVRHVRGDSPGPYTWWSWRGQSWTGDAGWRIDYQLASAPLARAAVAAGTDREAAYEARMSDHSPVVCDYDLARLG